MITLKEKYNALQEEETILIPYADCQGQTVYDLIPDNIRNSRVIIQVIYNHQELDDEKLKTTYLKDGDKIIFRAIPQGPFAPLLPFIVPIIIGVGLQLIIRAITGPPKKIRADRGESPTLGFNSPQMTTRNGTPINLFYGQLKLSGQLLQSKTEIKLLPDQNTETKLFMLIGLGEGGEQGWESIAGVAGEMEASDISQLGNQLFLNDNAASTFTGIKIYTRLGKKHQTVIANFNETVLLTTTSDFTLLNYTLNATAIFLAPQHYIRTFIIRLALAMPGRVSEGYIYPGTFPVDAIDILFAIDHQYVLARNGDVYGAEHTIFIDWKIAGTANWNNSIELKLYFGPLQTLKLFPYRIPDLNSTKIDVRIRGVRAYYPLTFAQAVAGIDDGINSLYNQYKVFNTDAASGLPLAPLMSVLDFRTYVFTTLTPICGAYDATSEDSVENYVMVFRSLSPDLFPSLGSYVGPISKIRIVEIKEIISKDFAYPAKALLALEAIPTEQLHGDQPNVSVICKTLKVRVYTNPSTYTIIYSNNPAWVLLDLLTSERHGLGNFIAFADCDIQSFIDAATYCDSLVDDGKSGLQKRAEINVALDKTKDAWDWVFIIAQTASLSVYRVGGKYKVKPDQQATPVMMFNPGNSRNFVCGYTAPIDRVNYVENSYWNEEDNYIEDMTVSLDESVTEISKYVKETTELVGVTRKAQAMRLGNYKINVNKLSVRYATWEADVPAIRCEPNDVVEYACENVLWGEAAGLIKAATTNTVTLDKSLVISAGLIYKIRVWHKGETFEEFQIVNTPGTYETLIISGAWNIVPVKYEPYSFGQVDKVVKQFKIVDITRNSDLTAKIFGVQYDSNIYSDTVVPFDAFVSKPGFSPKEFPPDVTNLSVTERILIDQNGALVNGFDIFYTLPTSPILAYTEVWLGVFTNSFGNIIWEIRPRATNVFGSHVFLKGPFQVGVTYYIAVTSVSIFGIKKFPAQISNVTIIPIGKAVNPADVTNFLVTRNLDVLTFTWNPVPDKDLLGYEIRTGDNWEGGIIIGSEITFAFFQTNLFFADPTVAITQKFLIKAKDTSGNYSTNAATLSVSVEPKFGIESYVSRNEKTLTWPGVKVNTSIVSTNLQLNANQASGTYETPEIELTGVGGTARARTTVFIQTVQTSSTATWSSTSYTWDSDWAKTNTWSGPIGVNNFSVIIEWRYGATSGSLGSYIPFIPQEITYRYAQFRLTLQTSDLNFGGYVSEFRMALDAIEVFDSKKNIALNMATQNPSTVSYNSNVTFHKDSAGNPSTSLQVTTQDLGNNERFKITTKTLTGFTIEFRDGSGALLTSGTRTIDYVATGF